ncbi:integral membrane protein 2A-like isoform X1 [Ictalurus furcatus]|uniref:integral membrane protein 2A-like isoform X1 n=1 Tax=Ictalurus furcatus TaxID=66913 RepID=UPI00235079DF|nr:integral membrane protein 2A-like isoform X1 [Ictalurus furcatus]
MVKIAFNSALAQKALGKEVPVSEKDPETGSVYSSESSTGRCLLTLLGLAFIISGLVVGGACVYRYFTPKKLYHGSMQFTDIDSADMPMDMEAHAPYYLPRVDEDVEIRDNVAIINVPAPRFGAGDPAYILHDFKRKLTAYLDLTLKTCFVIPLNTSVVMLPQDLLDLFLQLMSGSYKTHLVHEDLVVTERIDDLTPLGYYIYSLCEDRPTYKMQRRSEIMGFQKRSVEDCSIIRHFENKFVTETRICRA